MEWLTLLVSHPSALDSLLEWLKAQEQHCIAHALDVPETDIPVLRGKRDGFRDVQAYITNNMPLIQRGQVHMDGAALRT